MSQFQQLQEKMKDLRLVETAKHLPYLIKEAEQKDHSYTQFLLDIATYEQTCRQAKQLNNRLKWANFPFYKTLEEFDLKEQKSLSNKNLNRLKDLTWIEQLYNLILLGPPGVGNYGKFLFMVRNKCICPI
ncbi:ATP-binding protein [Robertmurraya sp. FSL R5-0851]|uniref:ATP-binding protein n=1 Tax=Robertmurraya sp. FSL R5-0851 TaxID=2921584 RepID=UPI0030FC82B3